jgi:hypothetical protein
VWRVCSKTASLVLLVSMPSVCFRLQPTVTAAAAGHHIIALATRIAPVTAARRAALSGTAIAWARSNRPFATRRAHCPDTRPGGLASWLVSWPAVLSEWDPHGGWLQWFLYTFFRAWAELSCCEAQA